MGRKKAAEVKEENEEVENKEKVKNKQELEEVKNKVEGKKKKELKKVETKEEIENENILDDNAEVNTLDDKSKLNNEDELNNKDELESQNELDSDQSSMEKEQNMSTAVEQVEDSEEQVIKDEDFSFLKVGDMIWAKRYDTEEEMNQIPIGHREGPFVIIKMTKTKTYGLPVTSKPHQDLEWRKLYYPLGRLTYDMTKNSYVSTVSTNLLNDTKYVKYLGHLTDYDLNKLKKTLYIIKHSTYQDSLDLCDRNMSFKYEVGDIIEFDGNRFYIYDIDKKAFYVNYVSKTVKASNKIQINNEYYTIDFKRSTMIDKKEKVMLVDTFNKGELKLLEKHKEKLQNMEVVQKTTKYCNAKIGEIIEFKNNYYYIYGQNKTQVLGCRVYHTEEETPKLKIDGRYWNTIFQRVTLKKEIKLTQEYKKIARAFKIEIAMNKKAIELRINRKKKNTEKVVNVEKKSIFDRAISEFLPMTIINNKNTKKHYLILNRKENVIEIVNINDMGDYCEYLLEDNNCPFEFYRMIDEEEFLIYQKKVKEFMELAEMLNAKS